LETGTTVVVGGVGVVVEIVVVLLLGEGVVVLVVVVLLLGEGVVVLVVVVEVVVVVGTGVGGMSVATTRAST